MPASDRLPVRSKAFLTICFSIYAAGSLGSMATMSIGAAVAALAVLVATGGPRGLARELRDLWTERSFRLYAWAALALVAALALSTLVAALAPLGWNGRFVQAGLEDCGKYWYFAWPLVLVAGLRMLDSRGRKTVLTTWLVALGLISIVGVIQHFTGWPREQRIPSSPERFHATLFFGHHLSTASILIFPFFAALDFIRQSLPSKGTSVRTPPILRPIALMAIAWLALATLFFSYSRMVWVALPVGVAVWSARFLRRRQVVACLAAAGVAIFAVLQVPVIRTRLADNSLFWQRKELWLANLEFLKSRPLTGAGFRRNIEASTYYLESILPKDAWIFSGHAHNNLIDMLGGTGLLGAAAWLFWCGVAVWLGWRALKVSKGAGAASGEPAFAWGLLCAWIVFHLNGLTQANFVEGKVMHQMMWAIAWSLFWVLPSRPEPRAEAGA